MRLASPAYSISALDHPQGLSQRAERPARASRTHWLIILFIITSLLPTSTSVVIGSLRISPYRAVLLASFIPLACGLFGGRYGRITAADWLMLGYSLWACLSLLYHHGPEVAVESGGIFLVEAFGAYMIGRCLVRSEKDFQGLARLIVVMVLMVGVFAVAESVTGIQFIRKAFASIFGGPSSGGPEPRFGFHRAFAGFDHPILYGVFASSAAGLAWYAWDNYDRITSSKVTRFIAIAIATLASVSSGAMAAMMVQVLLILWDRTTRTLPRRWWVLVTGILAVYFIIDVISNRSGMAVLVSYLTFSTHTAYIRMFIWHWGFYDNVLPNPIFGIGFNEWVRPSWKSGSVDNFWLVTMMMYGLPAFVMLAGSIVLQLRTAIQAAKHTSLVAMGWIVTMAGLIVSGCTVHYWNSAFVWFCFLSGLVYSFTRPQPQYHKH